MPKFTLSMLAVFFITLLFFNGCSDDDSPNQQNTINGSGKIITETRTVGECSGIVIASAGNVELLQSTAQEIRVEADDNIINDVITVKENGLLKVGLKQKSYSNIKVKVYASLTSIRKCEIQGAGNIECEQPITSDSLYLFINGAGNIKLKGTGNYLNCLISGAGNIEAQQYITKECYAVTKGVGNCTINVTDKLDASVEGVGSIFYYGNPKDVNTKVSGVGSIVKK